MRRTILVAAAILCLPLAACDEAKQAADTAGCKAVDAGVAALAKTDDLSGGGIKKLSDAVASAETDPEAAKQKVADAAANLSSSLDDAKTSLNC